MSHLEDIFAHQLRVSGLPEPRREASVVPGRRWRFDFAWYEFMIALEVEGGQWTAGRHNRPKGFEADCEKYNAAALAGWTVLRATGAMVRDGRALAVASTAIREAIA